eukprot:403373020
MNTSMNNTSHRSITPTPRQPQIKAIDSNQRRKLTKDEKQVLKTIMIDERDLALLKEYLEIYSGNLKKVEDETSKLQNSFRQMKYNILPTQGSALSMQPQASSRNAQLHQQLSQQTQNSQTQSQNSQIQQQMNQSIINQTTKAQEIQFKKLLKNDIRDLEYKIMEFDNKNEKIEDEIKFQHQILASLIDDIRRLKDIDSLIEQFEQQKKRQYYLSGNGDDYRIKTIADYTIEDFQSLVSSFPVILEQLQTQNKELKYEEKNINKENEVVSKKIQSISSAIMIKDMDNRAKQKKNEQ